MRKYTKEERDYISKFDSVFYKDRYNESRFDTASQKQINLDYYDEDGMFESFIDHMDVVVNSIPYTEPNKVTQMAMTPKQVVNLEKQYTASDYFALPSMWYGTSYVDKLHKVIDEEKQEVNKVTKGGVVVDYPNYPGITSCKGMFTVRSFFKGENTTVATCFSLEEAKRRLKEYNRRVTKRGYGVDYE
jgi:hypothetical protein